MSSSSKKLKVTLLRSIYGRKPGHSECVKGLGLSHIHQVRVINDTPENRGMIRQAAYLLSVEEI